MNKVELNLEIKLGGITMSKNNKEMVCSAAVPHQKQAMDYQLNGNNHRAAVKYKEALNVLEIGQRDKGDDYYLNQKLHIMDQLIVLYGTLGDDYRKDGREKKALEAYGKYEKVKSYYDETFKHEELTLMGDNIDET